MKCMTTKITEGSKIELYTKFIDFQTKNEQDGFLQSLIELKPVAKKKPINDKEVGRKKPKGQSYVYWLSGSEGKIQVCKTAFQSVFGISSDRIRRLCNLLKEGKSPQDKRGKGHPGNAKSVDLILEIQNHINSFPVKKAHYTNEEWNYLDSKLNVKIMWQMFKNIKPDIEVDYQFYLKIFNGHFNLKFGQPQVDTCCTCEELNVKIKSPSLNDAAKRATIAELIVHKRRADKFFKKLHAVKEKTETDPTIAGLSFDFMQNLQLPQIPIQDTFYLRQLSVSVFNVHDLRSGRARFYLYHEGIARKSPDEVCSFLFDYINENVGQHVKHLDLFSDSCGGQNKNHAMVRLCLMLVAQGRFQFITHYFPIRGHSYLPCDRDFSMVKRKIRKMDRIYLLKEYAELIIESSKKMNFEVKIAKTEEVLHFKEWWPQFYRKNAISVETQGRATHRNNKQHFHVTQFMQFCYSHETVGVVKVRSFIDGAEEHTFQLTEPSVIPPSPMSQAYQDNIPINEKKMHDLRRFLPFLPKEEIIQSFYSDIYNWSTCVKE